MPTQASIFCLRPSLDMYHRLLDNGAKRLQKERSIVMRNRSVYTEQDYLNMFFAGRIHYIPCRHGRGGGKIVHTSGNSERGVEDAWKRFTGKVPDLVQMQLYVARRRGLQQAHVQQHKLRAGS